MSCYCEVLCMVEMCLKLPYLHYGIFRMMIFYSYTTSICYCHQMKARCICACPKTHQSYYANKTNTSLQPCSHSLLPTEIIEWWGWKSINVFYYAIINSKNYWLYRREVTQQCPDLFLDKSALSLIEVLSQVVVKC